jgi:RNase P subunit RPR2
MRPIFCPRCHRQIALPEFLRSGRIKAEGSITIGCGNCGKGKVRLPPTDLPVAV